MSSNQSAQTSGGDIQKAATAFTDGAGQIQGQVQQVASSRVTAKQAGRHFQQAGDAYQKALDKLEANVKAFADNGNQLSRSFTDSAKEYSSADQSGSHAMKQVRG